MEATELKLKFSTDGEAATLNAARSVDREIKNIEGDAHKAGGGLRSMFSTAGGFVLGGVIQGLGGSIFQAAGGLLHMSANAEQAKLSLETVTGGAARAQELFSNIQKFAAATPFSFPELEQSAINLEAFGLKTEDWLTTIGDTASAMGKSVDQVTQAVLDANTGQFERLKELGVQATVEGDKLKFNYMKNGKEITETVDRNNKEIVDSTLKAIWDSKYQGAMEKQSHTFAGQWSTLKDNISMSMMDASGSVFSFATTGLGFLNDIFANGFFTTMDTISPSVSGMIESIVSVITGAKDKISGAIHSLFGKDTVDIPGYMGIPGGGEITTFTGPIRQIIDGMVEAFGEGSPVKNILDGMSDTTKTWGRPFLLMADAFGTMKSAYDSGGIENLLANLGDALKQIADAGLQLGEITLHATFDLISNISGDFLGWLNEQLGTSPMAGIPIVGNTAAGQSMVPPIDIGNLFVTGTVKLAGALADLGKAIRDELGGQATSESIAASKQAGADLAQKHMDAISEGMASVFSQQQQDNDDGGGFWSDLKTVLNYDPSGLIASMLPASIVNWNAAANTYAGTVASAFWGGVKKTFAGYDTQMFSPDGTPVLFHQGGVFDEFSGIWDTVKDLVTPDFSDWTMPTLPDWVDFSWLTGPLDTAAKSITTTADTLLAAWKYLTSVKAIIGGLSGGGDDTGAGTPYGTGSGGHGTNPAPRGKTPGPPTGSPFSIPAPDTGALTAALTLAGRAFTTFNATANTALASFVATIQNTAAQTRSAVGAIAGAFSPLPFQLGSIGANAANAFSSALWRGVADARAAATAMAAAVDLAVASRLQIQSPSRVMDSHGRNTVTPFLGWLNYGADQASLSFGRMSLPHGSSSSGGSGRSGGDTYVFDGCIIGGDIERWISDKVKDGTAKIVDRRLSGARLQESR